MLSPNLFTLLVADIPRSVRFYSELLGMKPIFESPHYVSFLLDSGVTLSIWSGHLNDESQEEISHHKNRLHIGQIEISFMMDTETEVDKLYNTWVMAGVQIAEAPEIAVFGKTFVASDPDGHRLRVCLRD